MSSQSVADSFIPSEHYLDFPWSFKSPKDSIKVHMRADHKIRKNTDHWLSSHTFIHRLGKKKIFCWTAISFDYGALSCLCNIRSGQVGEHALMQCHPPYSETPWDPGRRPPLADASSSPTLRKCPSICRTLLLHNRFEVPADLNSNCDCFWQYIHRIQIRNKMTKWNQLILRHILHEYSKVSFRVVTMKLNQRIKSQAIE